MTEIVPFPRLTANAFISADAGCERFDSRSRKTIVAVGPPGGPPEGPTDEPPDGPGIGVSATGITCDAPAPDGRGGGPAGSAGNGPDAALPASATGAAPGATGSEAAPLEAAEPPAGASKGSLCTGLRGAGDGGDAGALTAGMLALATGVPAAPPPEAPAFNPTFGGGGGAVPTPNRPGEAVGDDGSASGADCAACCALVRSATSDAVNLFSASWSGGSGLAGTVAIFGYG